VHAGYHVAAGTAPGATSSFAHTVGYMEVRSLASEAVRHIAIDKVEKAKALATIARQLAHRFRTTSFTVADALGLVDHWTG
jgi:hypothetical protein